MGIRQSNATLPKIDNTTGLTKGDIVNLRKTIKNSVDAHIVAKLELLKQNNELKEALKEALLKVGDEEFVKNIKSTFGI